MFSNCNLLPARKTGMLSLLLACIACGAMALAAFSNSQAVAKRPAAKSVSAKGVFSVYHLDDFAGGKPIYKYQLARGKKNIALVVTKRTRVVGATSAIRKKLRGVKSGKARSQLISGYHVKIRGKRIGRTITVRSIRALRAPQIKARKATTGPKKVAVILFKFANTTSVPFNVATVRERVFTGSNSANAYFEEMSDGEISLVGKNDGTEDDVDDAEGDVFDYVTIPENDGCSESVWTLIQHAKDELEEEEVDLSGYDYFVGIPGTTHSGCTGGVASGIPGTNAYAAGIVNPIRTIAHELGHLMGMAHASSIECPGAFGATTVPPDGDFWSESCTRTEYGDPFSVMGGSTPYWRTFTRHPSAAHKARLGVIPSGSILDLEEEGYGTYSLYDLEHPLDGNARLIRIPREDESEIDTSMYVDVRTNFGVFDNFVSGDPVVHGVTLRVGPDLTTAEGTPYTSQTHIINADPYGAPDSNPNNAPDQSDWSLKRGRAVYDQPSNFIVTLVSLASGVASIKYEAAPTGGNVSVASVVSGQLRITAGPGQSNSFLVVGSGGTHTVEDNGAPLAAGTGCTQVSGSANAVTCSNSSFSSVKIDSGDGDDLVYVNEYDGMNTTIVGGNGDDALIGGSTNDAIDGGPGNDFIDGGSGTDTVDYSAATSDVTVNLATTTGQNTGTYSGTDTIASTENVTGATDYGNTLTGNSSDNVLTGGIYPDTISGADGNDTLTGGDEDPYEFNGDFLYGGGGNDSISGGYGDDYFDGGTGADVMTGGSGSDTVDYSGRSSNLSITIDGTANDGDSTDGTVTDNVTTSIDRIISGSGNDTIDGTGRTQTLDLDGGAGNDTVVGGVNNDILRGSDGSDILRGNANSSAGDYLMGDGGDDTLDGGPGTDNVSGGSGSDTLDYSAATSAVTVNLTTTTGQNTGTYSGTDTIASSENIIGSDYADTLTGDSAANVLTGGLGIDSLTGSDGNDTILIREGVDDTTNCGNGTDSVTADQSPLDLTVTDCETVTRG